jgi:type I restriction enzyme M protein
LRSERSLRKPCEDHQRFTHRGLARRAPTASPSPLPVPLLAVITGELKAKVDRIWDAFWSGGIANPLDVMEQITYLLFIRRLDELQTAKENRANRLGTDLDDPIFPSGDDDRGRPYEELRWSRFKDREAAEMFAILGERVFPLLGPPKRPF